VITESVKDIPLINGPNRTLNTSLQHSIEIPSNMVPTINESGKVMRLYYKICVTVKIPGAEPNGGDKELSINLPITVGTEGKMMSMDDHAARNPYSSISRESMSGSPGGFRMPEPMIPRPSSNQPPHQFIINPERNIFTTRSSEDMPSGMPVPFAEGPEPVVNEDPRNNSTGYFSPQPVPDCYPPLEHHAYMTDSNISLDPSNYSPMPTRRQPTINQNSTQHNSTRRSNTQRNHSNRYSNSNDPYVDDDIIGQVLYKPEEESPR
jgi:hypothetical protein